MNKKIIIPVEHFTLSSLPEDDRILKLSMKFMHDGENVNKSEISLKAINNALNNALTSITGMPILASFEEDGSDFREHNEDEIGIGFVPQINNNLKIEKDEDTDKNYVYIDGYIWRNYSKNAVDILEKSKEEGHSCSIEIEVLDGYRDRKRKIYVINEFKFLGVTLLGSKYKPGMAGANVKIQYSQERIEELKELLVEVNNYYSKQSELSSEVPTLDDDINNKNKEGEKMGFNKEEFALKFGLTSMQLYEELYKCTQALEKYYDGYWEVECCRYNLRDFDDAYVYASDYKNCMIVRIPYSMQGDNPMLDCEKVERVKHTYDLWDMGQSNNNMDNMDDMDDMSDEFVKKEKENIKENMSLKAELETIKTEKENLTQKYSELETTISEKDTQISNMSKELKELESLRSYKLEKEKAEIQVKADKLYTDYAEYITDDEKVKFNKSLFTYSNFEDFESKVMIVVAPKIKAQVYALKQNTNFNQNDNHIDINLMPNNGIDNIKDTKPKNSREFLKEYVQE